MNEKLAQIEQLTREVMDEATSTLKGEELNQMLQSLEGVLNSLEVADSLNTKELEDDQGSKDIVRDLKDQMDQHPLFRRYSENAKAVLIQKMVNEGKPLATQEELVDFANDKVSHMETELLITKAYGKDEIIRVGRNSMSEDVGDGVAYNKGIEILNSETVESPENMVRTKALAVQNILKNPKELDKLVFEYYEI